MISLIANIISGIVGGVIGAASTHIFTKSLIKEKEKAENEKILNIIHTEIHDNVANKIRDNYPHNPLNISGGEFLRSKTWTLNIPKKQLSSLIKIYGHFSTINNLIININEKRKISLHSSELDSKIKKWQKICKDEIYNYKDEWLKNDSNYF